eukprot:TRINITY_DN1443_c2_g1_i1.p1 TRINITY_DN1443_c2_g1~~TRINITY_DN1443_c2_g1_i1.p1  ORF type:complete len:582 (-),score=88.44 TRINITY_DN1443_c2_g1_i1:443-2188(-)
MAAEAPMQQRRFAFIFPMASGHINPSLPIARALVRQGHEVHYRCREQMRAAIEDTGAAFHDEVQILSELYDGREPELFGAMASLKKEYGLEKDSMFASFRKLAPIIMELSMPGTVRFLQQIKPDVVVCCNLMCKEAVQAARFLSIPCVGLFTLAGPGSMVKTLNEFLKTSCVTCEELIEVSTTYAPAKESNDRLEAMYGFRLRNDDGMKPLGVIDSILHSTLTLVTTIQDLQDPTSPDMDEAYAQTRFEAVGPLLDEPGAVRAAAHKFQKADAQLHDLPGNQATSECPMARLLEARAAGRKVVMVSMGTVITGDSDQVGWHVKPLEGIAGERRGLTGRELCQAAWGGAFDAFGAYGADADKAPLLLVALGPQPNALGDLAVPDNALCMPVLPQVDLLKAGVDLFLTHGGQNSFTESLSQGVPIVVCPGFGDQPVNARKAVEIGVGLQIERPRPADGEEVKAAAEYRSAVCAALRQVASESRFQVAAQSYAKKLELAGGVPRAVGLLLDLAATSGTTRTSEALPTLLGTLSGSSPRREITDGSAKAPNVVNTDCCEKTTSFAGEKKRALSAPCSANERVAAQ